MRKYLFLILSVNLVLFFICELVCRIAPIAYIKLQNRYINRISKKNYKIFEKLLLLNVTLYYRVEWLFLLINPIKKYDKNDCSYFESSIVSYNFKISCLAIGIYSIITSTVYYFINNYNDIVEKIKLIASNLFNNQIIKNIAIFFNNNKWYVVLCISLLLVLYNYLKEKYTYKLLKEIQDEEVKKLINSNRIIVKTLFQIESLLRINVYEMLVQPKSGDLYTFLIKEAEDTTSYCKYDFNTKQFIASNNLHNQLMIVDIKLESIEEKISKIQQLIKEYDEDNTFSRLANIGKYIKGIYNFNPESFIANKNSLLTRERVEEIIKIFISSIEVYDYLPEDQIIEEINKNVKIANRLIIDTVIESIYYTTLLHRYNKNFAKAMKLKKHRDKFNINDIISNLLKK